MAVNDFDKACRYAAKLDPLGFLTWLFGAAISLIEFIDWLDTRTLPFPGETDRTCDTVARLRERLSMADWAFPIEFSLEPDAAMFGRLLMYLGLLWREERPAGNERGRYQVAAAVINLTGRGQTSRDMQVGEVRTCLQVIERNLAHEDAAELLAGIAAGTVARCMLPWVALMRGGDESGILEQWKELAGQEPVAQRRSEYAGLALVFADAADRGPMWEESLKGWNMRQSQVANEWRAEGKAESLLRVLQKRFPPGAPPELQAHIEANHDLAQLSQWLDAALDAQSLDEFRHAIQTEERNGA